MALITRFSRLLRADMHAVLDRIEEPEVLLRQALRDMDEALAENERRVASVVEEQNRIDCRQREIARFVAATAAELELCFTADREDLARTLLRRRLEHEALDASLSRRAQELAREHEQLQRRVGDRRDRLTAMRQKAELLAHQTRREDGAPWPLSHIPVLRDTWTSCPSEAERCSVRDEDVELALLRERERRAPA